MRRVWISVSAVVLLLVLMSQSVLAAPAAEPRTQGAEGIHLGSYELQSGTRAVGDLVVLGGPVLLREGSEFDGNLTVFGPMTLEPAALLDGQLVVMGRADLGGSVYGNVFAAGEINLRDTAYIEGDLSATGSIRQAPEAVVVGEIQAIDEPSWDITWPGTVPLIGPRVVRSPQINQTPRLMTFLRRIMQGIASVVLLGLLALVIASLWPVQTERVGRAIEEEPLTSYGAGLLTLILSAIAALLLAITICLSPFAAVGVVIVALGMLVGWVALGLVLGRRILVGIFKLPAPTPVAAAVAGTVLVTLIFALSRVLGPLHVLLLFLLAPLGVGAVLLTRFGTRPYATRGVVPPEERRRPIAPPPMRSTPPPSPPYDALDRLWEKEPSSELETSSQLGTPSQLGSTSHPERDSGVRIYGAESDADLSLYADSDEDR